MTRAETLAKAILADRNKISTTTAMAMACFACGRSFMYQGPKGDESGRFCCRVCREAYDAGFQQQPPLDVFSVKWPAPVRVGHDRVAPKAEQDLIRPRKLCVKCGAKLPVWVKGKKVPKTRKYCRGCSR